MTQHLTISDLFDHWPNTRAVLEDINRDLSDDEQLKLVAVQRMAQRNKVKLEYLPSIIEGAKRRGLPVDWMDFAVASGGRGPLPNTAQENPQEAAQ